MMSDGPTIQISISLPREVREWVAKVEGRRHTTKTQLSMAGYFLFETADVAAQERALQVAKLLFDKTLSWQDAMAYAVGDQKQRDIWLKKWFQAYALSPEEERLLEEIQVAADAKAVQDVLPKVRRRPKEA